MPTFEVQRLSLFECNRIGLGLPRDRDGLAPLDPVRIEQQLAAPGLSIVKDRHRPVADYHKLLLLERMEPGHEDMRLLATRESEKRGRDIGDRLVQVVA